MTIHWYPGHMHKAQKDMIELLPQVDLLIEILDARIPWSSENPAIARLRGDTPCIKVLSKSDLADPAVTALWQARFEQQRNVKTFPTRSDQPAGIKALQGLCREMVPHRDANRNQIHAMVVGIPNVGKSTLINILAGRKIARTGDEPAVTKSQQRIDLGNDIILFDTPGILWPKVENPASSYRLAVTGAIRDTAMEYDDVGHFAAEYSAASLSRSARGALQARCPAPRRGSVPAGRRDQAWRDRCGWQVQPAQDQRVAGQGVSQRDIGQDQFGDTGDD